MDWDNFVDDQLRVPFHLNYHHLSVWGLRTYEYNYTIWNDSNRTIDCFYAYCNRSEIVNDIIHSLVFEQNSTFFCNNITWSTADGILHVNNENYPCAYPSMENDLLIVPKTISACQHRQYPLVRSAAGAFSVGFDPITSMTAPLIHQITIVATTEATITVSINVTFGSLGGIVCTAAYATPNLPIAHEQVSFLGVCYSQNHSGNELVLLTIDSLTGSTSYMVFASGEDSFGNPSDLMSTSTETLCCQPIEFLNSYTLALSGIESYSSLSPQLLTQYLIQMKIPQPTSAFQISLRFTKSDSNVSFEVFAVPPTLSFDENSTNLLGSFLVYGAPGVYSVSVMVFGDHSKLDLSQTALVEVIDHLSLIPEPKLISAELSISGRLVISFDLMTDQALDLVTSGSTFLCDLLFDFVGAEHAQCFWSDPQSVVVQLEFNTVTLGDLIKLKAGVIFPYCPYESGCSASASNSSSVNVTSSVSLRGNFPLVQLNLPSVYSFCRTDAGLLVDATQSSGHAAHNWKYIRWHVHKDGVAVSVVQDFLSQQDIWEPIVIPPHLLSVGEYTITLGLGNIFQSEENITYHSEVVTIERNSTALDIIVNGPSSFAYHPENPLRLESSLTLSGCNETFHGVDFNQISDLVYRWRVYSNYLFVEEFVSESLNPATFLLRPGVLIVESSYYIQVRVKAKINGHDYSSSAGVHVFVVNRIPSAYISGGLSSLLTRSDLPISLTSSCLTTSCSSSWACVVSSPLSDFGQNCDALLGTTAERTQSSLELPASSFQSGFSYLLTLVTTEIVAGLSVTSAATVFIETSDSSLPISFFTSTNSNHTIVVDGLDHPDHVIHSRKFILSGEVNTRKPGGVNASWAMRSFSSPVFNSLSVPFTSSSRLFSDIHSSNGIAYPMGLEPYGLGAGQRYVFRLTAEVSSRRAPYYEMTIQTNFPPSGGSLEIQPPTGIALTTSFSYTTRHWSDDVDDFPLTYQFIYQQGNSLRSGESVFYVGLAGSQTYASTKLPAGREFYNYTLVCGVFVQDLWGSQSVSTDSIQTFPSEAQSSLILPLLSSISSNQMMIDPSATLRVLQEASSILGDLTLVNCSLAPNCSALNRENCLSTSHTCGPCLASYDGAFGDSNSLCHYLSSPVEDCSVDSDCANGFCKHGHCTPPLKSCPLNVETGQECSGNGVCLYQDYNGETLLPRDCTLDATSCQPVCSCDNSVAAAGDDCSLTLEEASIQNNVRSNLCEALAQVFSILDTSEAKYSITRSLLTAFHSRPFSNSSAECVSLLMSLTDELLQHPLVHLYLPSHFNSDFLLLLSTFYAPAVYPTVTDEITIISKSFQTSLQQTMIPGQLSVAFTSPFLRIESHYDYLLDLHNYQLSTPSTSLESYYQKKSTVVHFPSSGLDSCVHFEDYAQFALIVYLSTNSFAIDPTISVKSSLFTLRSYSTATALVSADPPASAPAPSNTYSLVFPRFVDYLSNQSAPTCAEYSLATKVVNFCESCVISSYNSDNVTFLCSDASSYFCPTDETSLNQRRLQTASEKVLFVWSKEDTPNSLRGDQFVQTSSPGVMFGIVSLLILILLGMVLLFLWDAYDRRIFIFHRAEIIKKGIAAFDLTAAFDERGVGVGYGLEPFGHLKTTLRTQPLTRLVPLGESHSAQSTSENNEDILVETTPDFALREGPEGEGEGAAEEYGDGDLHLSIEESDVATEERGNVIQQSVNSKPIKEIFKIAPDQFALRRENQNDIFIDMAGRQAPLPSPSAPSSPLSQSQTLSQTQPQINRESSFAIKGSRDTYNDLGGGTHDFVQIFPPTSLLSDHPFLVRLWRALKRHHKWIRIFSYPSIRQTRLMRFLVAANDLLFIIFCNSLFYSLFYPDDNHCQRYLTSTSCLEEPSHFEYSQHLCHWDSQKELCSLRRPPDTVMFIVQVSMLIIVFSIFPRRLIQFILEKVCSKRPEISLSSEGILLSSEPQILIHSSYHNRKYSPHLSLSLGSDGDASLQKQRLGGASEMGVTVKMANDPTLYPHQICDRQSPEEEVQTIITLTKQYFQILIERLEAPWSRKRGGAAVNAGAGSAAAGGEDPTQHYQLMKYVMKDLQINPKGEFDSVSTVTRLVSGTPLQQLERQVRQARKRNLWIQQLALSPFEVGPLQSDYSDMVLLQQFVLEQLSPLTRFVISHELHEMDHCLPGRINPLSWILSWMLVFGTWGYLAYYSLHWTLTNGVSASGNWGFVLLVVILADVLVNDTSQIFFYYVLVTDKVRPQIRDIYSLLREIWEKKVLTGKSPMEYIRIVQHVSGACRAARSLALSNTFAGRILRLVDDTDHYLSRVQQIHSIEKLGLLATLTLWIPARLLGGCYQFLQLTSLDLIFSISWCCFILLNSVVVMVHPALLAALYLFLLLTVLFIYYIAKTQWYRHSMERFTFSFSSGSGTGSGSGESVTTASHSHDHLSLRSSLNKEMVSTAKWSDMNSLMDIQQYHSKPTDYQTPPLELVDEDEFNAISPMFEARTSSFFRRQRRVTDGVAVAMKRMTPVEESDHSPSSPARPPAPQIAKLSTIISKPNIQQMFSRTSSDGLLSGDTLLQFCDRVLNSLNVSFADGPLTEEEQSLILDLIPKFSLREGVTASPTAAGSVSAGEGLVLDWNGFIHWLELSLETVDIQRQSQKMRARRMRGPHQSHSSSFEEKATHERDSEGRDTDVSDLTMESVFLGGRDSTRMSIGQPTNTNAYPVTIYEHEESGAEKEDQI
jgi:hypothetical protein